MRVLLGITGGIAAYKTPELVRHLRRRGHEVRCVLTAAGARLVALDALVAVSGQAVEREMFPGDGRMPHIDLARWAELLLIAPATADVIGRFAHGLADDLLTTLHLALDRGKPLVLAPAMNTQMWEHPAVQANIALLVGRGARLVGPVPGELACGEQGLGAMEAPERIAAAIG